MSRGPRSAVAKTATRPPSPSYAELEARVAALTAELRETREQRTATSEILRVISRSPTDIRPVFDAIVARAAGLCEAEFSAVARLEDELLHLVALNNMS